MPPIPSLRYLTLFLLLSLPVCAQSKLGELGTFIIGRTTPDSLRGLPVREQELLVLKGTIAFPCPHIRVFTADLLNLAGVPVKNLSLVF